MMAYSPSCLDPAPGVSSLEHAAEPRTIAAKHIKYSSLRFIVQKSAAHFQVVHVVGSFLVCGICGAQEANVKEHITAI
jgi:hypothetical protein